MKTVVYIARHGARIDSKNPEWTARAKYPHDPELSPLGHKQATLLAEHLRDKGIRHIVSSPYLRARQTAQPLAALLNLPVQVEDGLCEWLNPDWSDARPELSEPMPLEQSLVRAVYPESDVQAWDRSGQSAKLLVAQADGPMILVAHGHTMCGAIFGLLGRRDVKLNCDYCALTEIHLGANGAVMVRNGDTSFLNSK